MRKPRVRRMTQFAVAALAALMTACSFMSSAPPAVPAAVPKQPDLAGHWVLIVESQFGSEEFQMTLQQAGTQLSGVVTGKPGSAPYTGVLDGQNVTFTFTIRTRGMQLKIDQSGVLEGDSVMRGKSRIGEFAEGKFTARKKS